jgi:hypothetical protein
MSKSENELILEFLNSRIPQPFRESSTEYRELLPAEAWAKAGENPINYLSCMIRCFLLILFPLGVLAQWNTDPSMNNVLYSTHSDSSYFLFTDELGEDGFFTVVGEGNSSFRFMAVDSGGYMTHQMQLSGRPWDEFIRSMPDGNGGAFMFRLKLQNFDSLLIGHLTEELQYEDLYVITGPFFSVPSWSIETDSILHVSILTENADTSDWEALMFNFDRSGLRSIDTLNPLFAPSSTVRFTYLDNGGHLESYYGYTPGTTQSVFREIFYNILDVPLGDLWDSLPTVDGSGPGAIEGDVYVRTFRSSDSATFMAIDLNSGVWRFSELASLNHHTNIFGDPTDWKIHVNTADDELVVLMKTRSSFLSHLMILRFDLQTGDLLGSPQYLLTQPEDVYLLDITRAGNKLILAYMEEYGNILYHTYNLNNHQLNSNAYYLRFSLFFLQSALPGITAVGSDRQIPVYVWDQSDWFNYKEIRAMAIAEFGPLTIEEVAGELEVFPNPFSEILHLNFPDKGEMTYILSDLQGRIVQEGLVNERQIIDTSTLPAGPYFLQLSSLNGKTYARKVVKF